MQLDDGTSTPATLIGYTRMLAGDPATAPSLMWTDLEVTAAINNEYLFLRGIAAKQSSGLLHVVALANLTADTQMYDNPAGWFSWISIEVEPQGKDIDTDSTANPGFLEPRNENSLLKGVAEGQITTTAFYFVRKNQYGLATTPTISGTDSIRLTYNKVDTLLSADADTPDFPATYHDLICYRAAITLKSSKDMAINDLAALMIAKQAEYERWASDIHDDDYDYAIPTAGVVTRKRIFKTGSILR